MKHLYRISLIFMLLTIFAAMVLGGVYLYKDKAEKEKNFREQEVVETAVTEEKTDCDTEYVILEQDLFRGGSNTMVSVIPSKYINKSKEQLEELLENEERAPSLRDREKGLKSVRLTVFSNERVVVAKTYDRKENTEKTAETAEAKSLSRKAVLSENQVFDDAKYYLMANNGYVLVYQSDQKTVYLSTGIVLDCLPDDLRQEILDKKIIKNEEELYNFLESYSS